MQVVVVGAGIVGLTAAIRLQEEGHAVTLRARELSPRTTSDVAAAIWYPYRAGECPRVERWAAEGCRALVAECRLPETGVFLADGVRHFHRPMGQPWWRDVVPGFRRLAPDELPPGVCAGYRFSVPIADMSRYLPHLLDRFRRRGGRIRIEAVVSWSDVADASLVVNCTGLGAKALTGDPELRPIRGEVVRVAKPRWSEFLLDTDHPEGPVYVVPRLSDCVLGGTAIDGSADLDADPQAAAAIVDRCARYVPELRELPVLARAVGLRPGRRAVRLEREALGPDRWLIHNYGHGGAGVSMAWGCAAEVAEMARNLGHGSC